MSAAIKIEITGPSTGAIVHRFQNFGEAIYRALRDDCTVNLGEMDRAMNSFVIRDIRRRDLGRITQIIKRELKRHHFEETATLKRL